MSTQSTPNLPRPIRVKATSQGTPVAVASEEVDAIQESWIVQDCWWTEQPIHRRYWEVVTARGHSIVVFRDLIGGRWFTHRA